MKMNEDLYLEYISVYKALEQDSRTRMKVYGRGTDMGEHWKRLLWSFSKKRSMLERRLCREHPRYFLHSQDVSENEYTLTITDENTDTDFRVTGEVLCEWDDDIPLPYVESCHHWWLEGDPRDLDPRIESIVETFNDSLDSLGLEYSYAEYVACSAEAYADSMNDR